MPKVVARAPAAQSSANLGHAHPSRGPHRMLAPARERMGDLDPTARLRRAQLLGLKLGGLDQAENVVPMRPKFNRDTC